MMVAMAGVSIPEFFLGVLLFFIFALTLRWFPVSGHIALTDNLSANLHHMLLPTIALGLPRAALLTRLVRASLLEVLRLEYVTTARAKGLSAWAVVLKHALKNALIPTVTVIGLQVGFLIGGAIVVETLFAMPGIGSFGVDAIIRTRLSASAGLRPGKRVGLCGRQFECRSAVLRDDPASSVMAKRGHDDLA